MSFELLAEPIRKYIRDKRWSELRPIQNAAISRIITTDHNYILASRTASGKTEAAFLPVLSKVDFNENGVQVLYVSPLIALINDQMHRIEELCKYLEVTVTKWHGEANKTHKEKLLANPQGIVLITPESLEAMFVNKPFNVKHLFQNLKYVVVDEIHQFIGTERGTQLKSILSRLQKINIRKFNVIGLSATIGDYDEAKRFTGDEGNTKVLLDRTAKDINAHFRFFESKTEELPLDLLKNLYLETNNSKALIFPNSRGRVEEIAVKLKKISGKVNGHSNYFAHHSSVNKEVREYVESFAKSSNRQNFCIACTSTLELGIDIGTIDKVIQVDATHNIASLIQRTGRSGRNHEQSSNLVLYATDEWNLLQSAACWELFREGFIEPPQTTENSFDVMLHQALSITKSFSGIELQNLIHQLKENAAFHQIETEDIKEIIEHLIEIDLLEKLQNEIIIGVEGEKVVNSRNFYTMFTTEKNFAVTNAGNRIGEVPFSEQIKEDENIFLAARVWKIIAVDIQACKIEVRPAKDGKKPKFAGNGAVVHPKIREKMLETLFGKDKLENLDQKSLIQIETMRKDFSVFKINDPSIERPLLISENKLELFTFSGTKMNRALDFLLKLAEIKFDYDERQSSFRVNADQEEFFKMWCLLPGFLNNIDVNLENFIDANPTVLEFSKWASFLPLKFQVRLIKERHFDFLGAAKFFTTFKIIGNRVTN